MYILCELVYFFLLLTTLLFKHVNNTCHQILVLGHIKATCVQTDIAHRERETCICAASP